MILSHETLKLLLILAGVCASVHHVRGHHDDVCSGLAEKPYAARCA